MLIERKISINKTDYLLGFRLLYDSNGKLVKQDGSYFDLGDLSIMIESFEKNYSSDLVYDNYNIYMNDIIYLFDRFPFLAYVKDISYSRDGKIEQIGCIENKEIESYIEKMKIVINRWDKSTCICPMLYK